MNKIVKYGLCGVGAIVGLTVAGVAYIALTFDPNDYKGEIVQYVKETKQRDLKLDGDIKLSFFPNIGADLGKVSLSEHNKPDTFAEVQAARVSLALVPLFRKQIVVNEVVVSGLSANLVRYKDGTTNIDDLLSKEEEDKKEPVQFDIASVAISNTKLGYRDEASGAEYAISELTLNTGHVAEGKPTKIDLSAKISANQPKVAVSTKLNTSLLFNLEKQQHQLSNLQLSVEGAALDISNLKVTANLKQLDIDVPASRFDVLELMADVSGVKAKDKFELNLNAPKVNLAGEDFSANKLVAIAKLDGELGKVNANVSLPDLVGNTKSISSQGFALTADLTQPHQTLKTMIRSPLQLNIPEQKVNLSNLTVGVQATGEQLPNKAISSEMKGSLAFDGLKQHVQVNLVGGLLQSQVKAAVAVNGFEQPAINFDVDVDKFDADLYLPKATPAAKPAAAEPEKPIDLSALRKLNLDGKLRVGDLKAANVKLQQLQVGVKAHQGVLNVNPLSANLYQGQMSGSATINANAKPVINVNQTLNNINVAPLTKDAADFDMLEGRGTIALNVTTTGDRVSAFKQSLNGTMSLNLADGAVKGINIAKQIRDAKAIFKQGEQTAAADDTQKTDFSELKASFKIVNGVASNNDLSMKSPLLRLGGEGEVNIPQSSMDYLTKATLVNTLKGQGGRDDLSGLTVPVRIKGPFDNLKYTLDFKAMVRDAAKQKVDAKVEEKKEEVKEKIQNKLQDAFKGLFN